MSLFTQDQTDAIANEIKKQVALATGPLNTEIQSLRQQLSVAPSTSSPTTRKEKEKIKDPDTYKGNRDKTKSFIMQVQLVFDAQSHIYDTEVKKIRYAASFCREGAWDWFQGHIEAKTFETPGFTYQNFTDKLLKDYGEVDTHHESLRKLRKLNQRGPCSKYTTDFNILANRTQLNYAAKMDEFRRGLKDGVKDMLVNMSRPTDLEELQRQAIDADFRIFERMSEKKNDIFLSRHHNYPAPPQSGPVPMNVDSLQPNGKRKGPLTAEEKQRRRDNKLCLYCGGTACGGYPDVNACSEAPKKTPPRVGFS